MGVIEKQKHANMSVDRQREVNPRVFDSGAAAVARGAMLEIEDIEFDDDHQVW